MATDVLERKKNFSSMHKDNRIEYGSIKHENLIRAAYNGMTKDDAKRIIAERKKDIRSVSYDDYQTAKGLLIALSSKPGVSAIPKRPLISDD